MASVTASVSVGLPVRRFGKTARRDAWWVQPLLVFLGLSTFLVYATWAAFRRSSYWGENSFPLAMQNIHRYMLFLSVGVLAILAADVYAALWFPDPATGRAAFGIGVGTLVLAANVVLLSGYLFGCHSMRHVVGGCADRLSSAPLGVRTYACVSCLNRRHMVWAWTSLFSVGFSDLYVRLCSMGVWSDVRIW